MKYYIISGEASGDLIGSLLIKQMKLFDTEAHFRGWGGDLMSDAGVELVKHYRNLAFMGFAEVVKHLPEIMRNIKFCKSDILSWKPDVLVLIDYPGFNLRIAGFAKQHKFKVFYYVSPQVWAWKSSRVQLIKNTVDKMLVIFPFEVDFYKRFNYDVEFVGHPLPEYIDRTPLPAMDIFIKENNFQDKPIVALLPGSRKQEISTMLPVMISIACKYEGYQFIIAGAPSVSKEWYQPYLYNTNVKILFGQTYSLLRHSSAALVTSGTATLEAALCGIPEAVCYKTKGFTGMLSYLIARRLIGKKLKYISIVNIILQQEAVKEFIQDDMNEKNLSTELNKLLSDIDYRNVMHKKFSSIREKLAWTGASEKAARIITEAIIRNP